jgi:hypothetical protein
MNDCTSSPTVNVGDLILARSRALICGSEYEPKKWKKNDYNSLGNEWAFSYRDRNDEHLTPCVIIVSVQFPGEMCVLNHFHVLLPDGRIARIFDNVNDGFWLKSSVTDPKDSLVAWQCRHAGSGPMYITDSFIKDKQQTGVSR